MLSNQTHPACFPEFTEASGSLGVWTDLGSNVSTYSITKVMLEEWADVYQCLWYSRWHIKTWISFNSLCSETGKQLYKIHTMWFLCSYFLLHSALISSEHLWASIVVFSLMKVKKKKMYPHCLFFFFSALLLC